MNECRARGGTESGASLVEAAIVAPLFFALVFGVIEIAYAWFGRMTVEHMSVVGARSGSGEADEVLADYAILQSIANAAAGIGVDAVDVVVVYRATGPGDRVPAACKATSVYDAPGVRGCNRYTGADLRRDPEDFGCVGPPGPVDKIDRYWCPTTRKTALQGANGPPDYIGVYVEATHDNVIGRFGPTLTFRSDTVIRIEPRTRS